MYALEGKRQKKDIWQEVLAFHSDRSPYPLSEFDANRAEVEFKGWCILECLGQPQTFRKTALTLLNNHVPELSKGGDFGFLHELIASTFPGKGTLKDTASRDV